MLSDLDRFPNKVNWAPLVRNLLISLGFIKCLVGSGGGELWGFITVLKQRLTDNFVQNWHLRLEDSSRAIFYKLIASFQFQPYLLTLNVSNFCNAISKLRMSSHRLEIEACRWVWDN